MKKPIDVELYSLRTYAEKDFPGVLKRVAEMGYTAVEPAGYWNIEPRELKKMLDDLGLKIYTDHTTGASLENISKNVDILGTLGINTACTGYWTDAFKDEDAIKATAEKTNRQIEAYAAQGITVYQHNHFWEFGRLPDGRIKYDVYAALCPKLKYQIDCFWSTNKGLEDPVDILKRFAPQTISIHMKDGICTPNPEKGEADVSLMPLGTGSLPIPELMKYVPDSALSVIVELDEANIEMWDAIEQSYRYMTENGFVIGNK